MGQADSAPPYNPFDRSDALIRDPEHVRVTRLEPENRDDPNQTCRYRKEFKPLKGDSERALYWEQREIGFLRQFEEQKIKRVVQYAAIQRKASAAYATPQYDKLETLDAGVTIADWLRVQPRYADGRLLDHPFQPIGMFLRLLRACLSALREIHSHGIQHLDFKHDNVCIPFEPYPYRDGQPLTLRFDKLRLIDFSYSTGPGNRLRYLPPVGRLKGRAYQSARWKKAMQADERKAGPPFALDKLDGRCDLYSLGWLAEKLLDLGLDTEGCPRPDDAEVRVKTLARRLQNFDKAWFKPGKAKYDKLIADIDILLKDIGPAVENHPFTVHKLHEVPLPLPLVEKSHSRSSSAIEPEMVRIPAGRFMMGAPQGAEGRYVNDSPRHEVAVQAFALGKYAVTRGEFARFAATTGYDAGKGWRNPGFAQTDKHPVIHVSWDDAQAYVRWLNIETGKNYRLPNEAEWEYACAYQARTIWSAHARGKPTKCARGIYEPFKTMPRHIWVTGELREVEGTFPSVESDTVPVDIYSPNAFGLHYMNGNIWEWCEDIWHHDYVRHDLYENDNRKGINIRQGGRFLHGALGYGNPSWLRNPWAPVFSEWGVHNFSFFGFRLARTLTPDPEGRSLSVGVHRLGWLALGLIGLILVLLGHLVVLGLWQAHKALQLQTIMQNMVDIPAGEFVKNGDGTNFNNKQPRLQIKAFKLGQYEVSQAQWRAVMGDNPSYFSNCGGDCPVENVSYEQVTRFISTLNRLTKQYFRLPTEAEWEYACRAGGAQRYCGSDEHDMVAWHEGNSHKKTHPVGQKQKNAFGLYDMSGNVWDRLL